MTAPNECPACGEHGTVMTMRGICLPCDRKVEADVATLEAILDKKHQQRHYQAMAVEAAALKDREDTCSQAAPSKPCSFGFPVTTC